MTLPRLNLLSDLHRKMKHALNGLAGRVVNAALHLLQLNAHL